LLLDLEGVVYEGDKLVDGALDAINKLLSHDFKIKYLTNTTVTPRKQILKKLLKFELSIVETDIFTPPIAASIFLKKNKISKIFLLTSKLLQEDFKEFIIDEVKPEAIILGDLYKAFNWEKLNEVFQLIHNNDTLIVALHKNKYCKRENKIGLDLGPFVTALEYATSKKSILIGKPEKNFFNLAIEDMGLRKGEVIMIGDDIFADIGGAKNNSISTIQVRTGKFQKKDETYSYLQPDYRINSIVDLPKILEIT
jgi:HAD superfamily hydrolase (TIGR01458 family)|tara:strand:+ start:1470 stop:2228 length:759 start_codon:yes stop_codon:yes gene_type:complete